MNQEARFEHAWPWLAAALHRFGNTHSKEHIWGEIMQGKAQLHALARSGMLTTIEVYPTGVKELRFWLAGGDLHELTSYEPVVIDWAKGIGCNRAAIAGRIGWEKALPGYRKCAVLLMKDL